MTDRPRTNELWTPPITPPEPRVWVIHRHRPFCTTDLEGPHAVGPVRVVEDLAPEAMLAWALRNAGRERVVPIIEQALIRSVTRYEGFNVGDCAQAVFDALNGGGDG